MGKMGVGAVIASLALVVAGCQAVGGAEGDLPSPVPSETAPVEAVESVEATESVEAEPQEREADEGRERKGGETPSAAEAAESEEALPPIPEVDYALPAGIVMGEVREDRVGRYISVEVDPEGPLVHPEPAVRAADILEYVDPEDVDAALRRGAQYMVEGVLDSPQLRDTFETDIEDWLNENRSWYSASFRPQLRQGLLDGRYFDMSKPQRDVDGDGIADEGSAEGDFSIAAWAPTTDTPRAAEIDLRVTRVSALPSHEHYPLIAIDYAGAWVRVADVAERDPGFEALPFRTNYRLYLIEAGDTWVVHHVQFSWSRMGDASELPEPWQWLE